jgi:hypothetical protein
VTWGSGSETGDAYEPGASEMVDHFLDRRMFADAADWAIDGIGISARFTAEDVALLVAYLPDALEVVEEPGYGWLVTAREGA